ncbi:MAG TPA: glutamine synthetase family protein [Candidatus Acidoferrales bacterium]|nr:glutamine synthetase family protein [Candidatus Acidoferrales bacterium]
MPSAVNGVQTAAQSRRETIKSAKERNVSYVRLGFVDIFGIEKNVVIPVAQLEAALDGKVTFDGGSIDGFVRGEEVDMVLRPDPATFAILPWTSAGPIEARMLCDIANADGTPFEGCPRTTLRRVIEDSRDVIPKVASSLEVEFYLFDVAEDGSPTLHTSDSGSYFDFSPSDRGDDSRTAMVAALESMGIRVQSAHHEHGAGQHEIDTVERPILTSADALVTLRAVVKQVATRHNVHATFMPKPLETSAGNGLHVYFDFGEADEETRLQAIGGLLDHAQGCTAVCNPTVNSYKRLVAAWDAPVFTVWSHRSANALVRLPAPLDGTQFIEVRSPDASCNPYLSMAVLIESMADGIRKRILPGNPFTGSTYDLSDSYRAKNAIRKLPGTLGEAIAALDADPIVRGALGDHIYHAFRDAKLAEYERYRRAVHAWERDAYLRTF